MQCLPRPCLQVRATAVRGPRVPRPAHHRHVQHAPGARRCWGELRLGHALGCAGPGAPGPCGSPDRPSWQRPALMLAHLCLLTCSSWHGLRPTVPPQRRQSRRRRPAVWRGSGGCWRPRRCQQQLQRCLPCPSSPCSHPPALICSAWRIRSPPRQQMHQQQRRRLRLRPLPPGTPLAPRALPHCRPRRQLSRPLRRQRRQRRRGPRSPAAAAQPRCPAGRSPLASPLIHLAYKACTQHRSRTAQRIRAAAAQAAQTCLLA